MYLCRPLGVWIINYRTILEKNIRMSKCEVKMAGYWPSSFSACLWTETYINSQKKKKKKKKKTERGQYPAISTEQAWLIKDFFIAFEVIFLAEHGG